MNQLNSRCTRKSQKSNYFVTPANGARKVDTSGGSIHLGRITGSSSIHTSGGNISIDQGGNGVNAHTSGGSIKIGPSGGNVNADTSGGSISVYLPEKVAATVSAQLFFISLIVYLYSIQVNVCTFQDNFF